MGVTSIVETMRAIRLALIDELLRAQNERQLLKTLDVEGLLARAAGRDAFGAELRRLETQLHDEVGTLSDSLGGTRTIASLSARLGRDGAILTTLLAEIRALAASLRELDALNASLAQRSLQVVRGYLQTLSPRAQQYTARGAAVTQGGPTTSMQSARL